MNPDIALFQLAIIERNSIGVASLIKLGTIDVNAPLYVARHRAMTKPLVLAAEHGPVETVQVLLDAGALVDAVDARGQTACMAAARADAGDIVELLVERGADLSIVDYDKFSALMVAVTSARTSDRVVAALIGGDAPLDHEGTLCNAASLSVRVCQMLLDRNVNVGQLRDQFQATPCHIACERSYDDDPELLDLLVNVARVDLDAVDHVGFTCLHRCAWSGSRRKLRWLINAGADIDAMDEIGLTPLHKACEDRQYASALLLVAAGANVHLFGDSGQTACHFAADPLVYVLLGEQEQEDEAMLCLLIAAGSDFESAFDVHGRSPQQRAADRNLRAPTADEIQAKRRFISIAQLEFVRDRAFEVCVGLQPLQLDALQMCEILVQSCGPVAPLIEFHRWWKIATTVKHFLK